MTEEAIKKEILAVFEYAHHEEDWVYPLTDALEGVSVKDALWKPGPDAMGIWEIVLHLAVWMEHMTERLRGENPGRPAEGAWPPVADPPDDAAWHAAQKRLFDAASAFRSQIEATPFSVLMSRPDEKKGSLLADTLCRFIHSGYHIGQIVKIRECLGIGPPDK